MSTHEELITTRVKHLQIIAAAMIFAICVFGVISWSIVQFSKGAPAPGDQLISLILLGIGIVQPLPVMLGIDPLLASIDHSGTNQSPEERAIHTWFTRSLIRYAVIEGSCFMQGIAYIIEYHWWSLAAMGGGVLIMLAMFPSTTRLRHYLESQFSFE